MNKANAGTIYWGLAVVLVWAGVGAAQDWPQWRGPNRDAKATGFTAPKTWPKELTQKWKVKVGDGVATPALVGDKLYVFSREGNDEIVRCLEAATGNELWQDKNTQTFRPTNDGTFPGPRSSPTVADGKVVTLGVNGVISCLDAASGKVLWRKDDFKDSFPRFHTSSSPIVEGGLVIAQLGKEGNGGIVAYELADGKEKWKWTGDSPAYGSPDLLTLGGMKVLVAVTKQKFVALNAADGKQLWETAYSSRYNAASPMVEGQTLVLSGAESGGGVKAIKLEKGGDGLAEKELWKNTDNSTQFNTPIVKDGVIYAISAADKLFCINAETGKTGWTTALSATSGGGGGGGGRGRPGYGSIVDAGPVLIALNPSTNLVVFEPNGKEYKELAKYKVGDGNTYAYPIASGNRIMVKDRDSVIVWTVE